MTGYEEFMQGMKTLQQVKPQSTGRTALIIVLSLITSAALVLWLTPWVQTAQGTGYVDTLRAEDRQQAISALVPGVIERWHVQEGQRVKQGDPIVTLKDQDQNLLERLKKDLQAIKQQRDAMEIALQAAELDYTRKSHLHEQGIVSARDKEKAQIALQESRTKLANVETEINQAETRLARQNTQTQVAPSDGVISRLLAAGVSTSLKSGDVLATFIPDHTQRAVVIEINGLDAPLVQPGRKVKLQFEGWPVFQLSGWPDSGIGTFSGIVDFVEPIATTNGRFRVWIKHDENARPWPDPELVRLGSRAKAWILLEEVRLGYEVWRQLNNFPPRYTQDTVNGK